jgi:hypothetical protein
MYDRYSPKSLKRLNARGSLKKDSLLFLRNLAGTEDTKSLRCQWYVRSFSNGWLLGTVFEIPK